MFFSGRPRWWQALRQSGLVVICVGVLTVGGIANARESGAATVTLSDLPPEARIVDRSIRSGGPFHSPKDGVVFGNRERRLPGQARGFYREYTVPTPGVRHRGARRIVCGGTPPTKPEMCFYTADHYSTFLRIVP